MPKLLSIVLSTALLSVWMFAQSPSTQQNEAAAQTTPTQVRFAPGTELRAQLNKTIDAKKAKPGEVVEAKTLDDLKSGTEVVAPRGSKILGHIVSVNPHEKDAPSRLEIAFDKMDLGNGSQVPFPATIQALAKPANNMNPTVDNAGGGTPMGGESAPTTGGGRGGMQQPAGMGQPTSPRSSGGMDSGGGYPQNAPSGPISPTAQGVAGISGVSLSSGPAHDTLLTSEKHNVKLDNGTQMVLRTQ
ncbi:MAG: hypothetical protein JOZ80_20045 [Acidobacteriaceae bacterium]|jgi:hypothetical protein|nr:hypothetical protein [Acidobacteriaceae bacterium]